MSWCKSMVWHTSSSKALHHQWTNDLLVSLHNKWRVLFLKLYSSSMVRASIHYLRNSSNLQSIAGILHVDYEALLPYLNESIKKNYQDISNIRTENQQLQKSIDILYAEFVRREAIVKYQHNPSSMFSDNAMPHKNKDDKKDYRRRTPIWQWILFVLAGVVLFISGTAAVYLIVDQNQGPDPHAPTAGPKGSDRDADRRALEDFFLATGGANWTNNYGWLTSLDMCTWTGIQCDTNGRVSIIRLTEYKLTGTIPASISKLDSLTSLSLTQNDISGTLPDSLFTMPSLVSLNLSYNPRLSGTIPNVEPPAIYKLWLRGCNMTGNVPNWLTGSKVQDLQLQFNRFTGRIPVLTLGERGRGVFESNQFEGSVPRIIGTIPTINLANNRLNGTLETWARSFSAGQLILANNSLSGHFPFTNSQLNAMTTLDISNNQFTSVRSDLLMPPLLQKCNASNNPFKCPVPRWLVTQCGATCK